MIEKQISWFKVVFASSGWERLAKSVFCVFLQGDEPVLQRPKLKIGGTGSYSEK